jgi:hypothetical protein
MLDNPMEGFNSGISNLAQALKYRQQMDRQENVDALHKLTAESTLKTQGLQQTASQMAIDKAKAEEAAVMTVTGKGTPAEAMAAQTLRKQKLEEDERDRKILHETLSTLGGLVKNGADPDAISKVAQNIISKTRFKDDFNGIQFTGQEFTVEKDFPDNTIPDKSNPGAFLPAGRYKITATPGANGGPINFKKVDLVDQKQPSALQVTEGALAEKLGRKPTKTELDSELKAREEKKHANQIRVSIAGAEARGKAYADERFYDMYNTETGKTEKIKGRAINSDDGGKYLSPQDPNVKADTGSLIKLTKGMDSVNAFEKGATQALDYAATVAEDFKLGKYPKANTISQLVQYHTGDPKVKGLRNALTTAATEYMKVINAGSDLTAAELSVMGQQRAKEIIESSDNMESLRNSIKIMKREMQISGDKFKAQRLEVQGRLKGYGGTGQEAGAQSPAPKAATHKYVPGKGIVEIQ